MTRQKEKKDYEAPTLTVVSFKAELGYALSGTKKLGLDIVGDGDRALESRTDGGYWGNNDDGWF